MEAKQYSSIQSLYITFLGTKSSFFNNQIQSHYTEML